MNVSPNDVPAPLGFSRGDPYEIEREIGRGGTAVVYLAKDAKHHRRVALKVLDQSLGAVLGAERFLAEIRTTANLQHPNILPLFDSGDQGGALFYVMPFVDGESLRSRLEREGPLPIDEAIRLITLVAHAIDYAHRHGVVHRDIKPENILLSDGVPIVADFGIAKAIAASQRGTNESSALTQVGMSLGTPAYMSPEQALGQPDIDGRTDVYALGCLLFEMLAGEMPFTGPTAHAVIAKHIMTPVPSIRTARDAVSPVIDAVVARAMAKDADARFATPADFAFALVAVPGVEPRPDYSQISEPIARTTAPIVGRQKEVAELFARLDGAEQGRGGLVLVGGEPGVGKTRLTEAVLLEARRRGYFCTVGHCYEMEGGAPYLAFVEQLEYACRVAPPGRTRAALGTSAAEIARIAPFLRQLFPDTGPPLDLPADQQRQYLFARMREYLERVAANVPLVMLFDDLHWADESTLLMLESLAQHAPHIRLLMLGTYRDVDLDVGRPFARSIERLVRQRLAERVVLRRMPESEVAELLTALGAPNPPPRLVQAIYRETEGNPFFVEEVFRHLREEGRVLDAHGRWLSELQLDDVQVPEGVKLVIGRRLERVGADCRNVLIAAAVIGPRFDLRTLEALGEVDTDTILDALERAEAAGLVLPQVAGRDTRYAFAHELIRQTLLGGLSLPRRQRRHQRTAEAIEKVFAGRIDTKIADLAYHLFQAGAAVETDRTTYALLIAARQALGAGAFDEARAHADRAVSILETEGDLRHAQLLHVRAASWQGMGKWTEAMADLDAAIPLLLRQGAPSEAMAAVFALGDMLGWSEGPTPRTMQLFQSALDAVPNAAAPERARLLSRAAGATALTAGYEPGLAMMEEAVRIARDSDDPAAFAECVGNRGILTSSFLKMAASEPDLAEAYAFATAHGARWEMARLGVFLGQCCNFLGDFVRGETIEEEARRAGVETGHVSAAFKAEFDCASRRWLQTGDCDAFVRSLRPLLEVNVPPYFHEQAVWADALVRFETAADLDPASEMDGAMDRIGMSQWQDLQWAEQFRIEAQMQPRRAREILERYQDRLPASGRTSIGGIRLGVASMVEGFVTLGERDRAAALYPHLVALMDDGNVLTPISITGCHAGIAAACGDDWSRAETHFEAARADAVRIGHAVGREDVARWHAWMLLQRRGPGDVERARSLLGEAMALAQGMGLVRRVRLSDAMLKDLERD
jgi:tRNA A-37 threonylcarbamoyl transferase component Bud32/tetratricopeptide (TPR) repeat protein